ITVLEYGDLFRLSRFALSSAQSGEELWCAEWFGNVILRARVKRRDFLLFVITNRQDDHWRLAPFAQSFENGEAFHVRQAKVEKNHVRAAASSFRQCFLTSLRFADLIILGFKHNAKEPTNLHLVVDNKCDRIHTVASLGSRIGSPIGRRMEKRAPVPS